MPDDPLSAYRSKRRFDTTPEPAGNKRKTGRQDAADDAPSAPPGGRGTASSGESASGRDRVSDHNSFVVQKHAARRLHYDVRIEVDGVMASWAVPKGPSYDPRVKRLAVQVEDHPLDYQTFEGIIPGKEYGAGQVIVWDAGTFRNLTNVDGLPLSLRAAIERGHLSIWLDGSKLRGGWSLTRTGREAGDTTWIMVKRRDDLADPMIDIVTSAPRSVLSDRTTEDIASSPDASTWTRGTATWIPPMLAQLTEPAGWLTPPGEAWIYERKFDGLRCLAVRNGDRVELWSRNHNPFTARFGHIVDALSALPIDNFAFDGELVGFDGTEVTGFGALAQPGAGHLPRFCIFDVLHLLGQDTRALPLTDRKRLLAQSLDSSGSLYVVPPLAGGPAELLAAGCAQGWEGIVAKRLEATYCSGRSRDWRKLKCTASQELVIGGWTEPRGARIGFGALLMGYYEGAAFRFAGKVGTGFSRETLESLWAELQRIEAPRSPFVDPPGDRTAHWTTPTLVAEVGFAEWTRDGRLRHPRFLVLRHDKAPTSVVREQ